MLSLADRLVVLRAEEQVTRITSLRSHGEKMRCLECGEMISRRRKFGLCVECFPKYQVRKNGAAA